MIILNETDIDALLPMADAIEVVDAAMRQVSDGTTELPLRFAVPVGGGNMMGVMPGAMPGEVAGDGIYGVKLISLFPGNPARGLSSHRGAMALFENDTGSLIGLVEAGRLTAIRTAAASAVATRALARQDAQRLAIIGTGEQAYSHLDAMCAVRPITELAIAGRDPAKARALAEHARTCHPGLQVSAGTDIRAAMSGADIICTVTAAREPIVSGDWLEPGQHLNVVGSSIPTMREVTTGWSSARTSGPTTAPRPWPRRVKSSLPSRRAASPPRASPKSARCWPARPRDARALPRSRSIARWASPRKTLPVPAMPWNAPMKKQSARRWISARLDLNPISNMQEAVR